MYGSNFWSVTERPRETRRRPIEAAAMPLPRAETTPPVTKTKRVWRRSDIDAIWRASLFLDPADVREAPGLGRVRTTLSSSGRREKLLGVPARPCIGGLRAQHPHELLHHAVALERVDARERGVLLDPEMRLGQRGDLRKVGDAQHLALFAQRAQPLSHGTCGLTA